MKKTTMDVIFIVSTCLLTVIGIYLTMTVDMQIVAVLGLMTILGWLAANEDWLIKQFGKFFNKEDGLS